MKDEDFTLRFLRSSLVILLVNSDVSLPFSSIVIVCINTVLFPCASVLYTSFLRPPPPSGAQDYTVVPLRSPPRHLPERFVILD